MLILSNVSTEFSESGTRHFIILCSPHLPGASYKVEADQDTIRRLQSALSAELDNVNEMISLNHLEELEDDNCDFQL